LKTAGSAEAMALRRRMSHLVRSLKPQTLRRLVEMGGDFVQRRKFVLDATAGMAVDAVLEILKAAADTSQQTISHSLVRLLSTPWLSCRRRVPPPPRCGNGSPLRR